MIHWANLGGRGSVGCRTLLAVSFFAYGMMARADPTMPTLDRVRFLNPPRAIQPVVLTDYDNQEFSLESLRGKVVLVFFGFTNCPDVCPLTMAKWKMLEATNTIDFDNVALVMISVDGHRDSPPVLKEYLGRISKNILGLTEDPEKVRGLADQFSAAFFSENPDVHDGHYNVSHSPQSFALDRNGNFRAEMYDPSIESLSRLLSALLEEQHLDPQNGEN